MKKTSYIILLATLGIWWQNSSISMAQALLWGVELNPETPNLMVDFARFESVDSNKVRLDLYYQVYNAGLQFEEDNGEWLASYEVTVIVRDNDGFQVAGENKERQVRVPTEAKAKSGTDYRASQFAFDLSPGKYVVDFTLRDLASKQIVNSQIKTNLTPFDSHKPELSDIEFAQAAHQADDSSSVFRKGNLLVVPSVSRAFGSNDDSQLLYYQEIYRGSDSDRSVIIETRLNHESKGMLYRDTLHVEFLSSAERQLRQISLAEFPPGEYEMEIFLRGRRNKKLAHQRHLFELLWTHDALVKFDWKTAIAQLSYITGPGELDDMKDEESVEQRKIAFAEFWRKRDPTVGTSQNEAKQEFYRRVRVSNQRYSILRREGWRTDRGRIFIQFGDPDEIDDYPYSPSALPYQIWHYYMSGRYMRFTFVDERMDGDYQLAFPYDGLYQTPDF